MGEPKPRRRKTAKKAAAGPRVATKAGKAARAPRGAKQAAREVVPVQQDGLYGYTGAGAPSIAFGLRPGRPVGDTADWRFGGDSLNRDPRRGGVGSGLGEILHVMSDADPQLSLALWQWMRLVNNGHDVAAVVSVPITQADGTVTMVEQIDPDGQVIVDELAKRVGIEYGGGMDQLVGVVVRTLLKEGAVAGEIEVSYDLRDIVDFHPVHPRRLVYRRVRDADVVGPDGKPVLGPDGKPVPGTIRRVLGINGPAGRFIQVSPDQVRFFPLDPEVENPYGHSPFTAAVQAIYFKAQMLRDLRKVMHVAGNPRLDVAVLYQTALKNVPVQYTQPGMEQQLQDWINAQIQKIADDYNKLEPDDGFVHWDHVAVKYVGPGGGGSINVQQVELVLNRQISAGVKMLPLLLGMNETSTETHGSIQWQVQVAGIESIQKIVRRLFEWFYSTSLEFYGSLASAKMQFDQHRTIDAMVEATTKQILANFHMLAVSENWETNDEAAEDLFGHAAVGPDPAVVALQQQVDQLTQLLTAPIAPQVDAQGNPIPAAAAPPSPTARALEAAQLPMTAETAAALRSIVREFSRTGDRKALLASLVKLYSRPVEARAGADGKVDAAALEKAMGKYEHGGHSAFYDLFPDVRDALKETGHLRDAGTAPAEDPGSGDTVLPGDLPGDKLAVEE